MDLIRHRSVTYVKEYRLNFHIDGTKGSGFCFDCDEHGVVDVSKLNPCAQRSYRTCIEGKTMRLEDVHYYPSVDADGYTQYNPILCTGRWVERKIWPGELLSFDRKVVVPGAVKCRCSREVELHDFTNTCECGADYNMSGQLLAPREQWGEECNETADDILRPGDPFDTNY